MNDANAAHLSSNPSALKPFRFAQNHGALFVLYLKTMLLSVCTLGIYSFWGRVAITKYLYSQTSFGNNFFDYHATGKEMFVGFIKGVCIIIPVVLVFKFIPFLKVPLAIAGYIGVIFFLVPLIILGKWRFRLSRSSYCNVRFSHNGEYKAFRKIWIKGALMSIVTLGFYSPILRNKIEKYYFDNARFGNLSFAYTGVDMEYFWIWLKGMVLTLCTLGIYSFWYAAKLNRYVMSHTTFNGRPFSSTMTGGGLLKVSLVNLLIVIGTLSFGFPIAVNRMYAYFFSNITLDAQPENIAAMASEMDTGASALASGLEEAANVFDAISGII